MTREGSSDQRAEHKEERVRTREGHGEDKAAGTEKKEDYRRGRENTSQKTVTGSVVIPPKTDMELFGGRGLWIAAVG